MPETEKKVKCWNCGGSEMVVLNARGHEYYECKKCKASNVILPTPGQTALMNPVKQTRNTLGTNTPRPARRVKNVKEKK